MIRSRVSHSAGRPSRSAFTLVELLVVIAIIGILIALLLPAVQAAREAARRSQCTNNLKQIGLSLHNYHDIHKCFPPGWMNQGTRNSTGSVANDAQWGWATFILPFIEEKPLHDSLEVYGQTLDDAVGVAPYQALLETPLDGYLCPSGKSDPQNADKTIGTNLLGTSNYVGCQGTVRNGRGQLRDSGVLFSSCPGNMNTAATAAQYRDWPVSFRDISDGTSNTFAAGERDQRCGAAVWPGVEVDNNTAGVTGGSMVTGSVCVHLNEARLNADLAGAQQDFACERGFSSQHPDGAVFALCDGSSRFVSDLVEYEISPTGCTTQACQRRNWKNLPATNDDLFDFAGGMGVYQLLGSREDDQPIPKDF